MSALKIVLIDANTPWMSDKSGIPDQIVLPIGLMYLSSYLKEKFGQRLSVKIINTAIDVKNTAELQKKLNLFKPDIIGFRVLTTNKFYFQDLAAKIKPRHKKALFLAGGPHALCLPKEVLNLKQIDVLILGEGELTFAELISRVLEAKDYHDINGIAYLKNNKLIINPAREPILNLDQLPLPDYSGVDLRKYGRVMNYGYTIRKQAVIVASRGCPFSCSYCFKFFGKTYRKRSALNVYHEIKQLNSEYGIKDFFFVDDNFNIDKQRCKDFFSLIIKNYSLGAIPKLRLYFTSGLRGDLLDEELIDLMVKAGTIWITFAVETVNKRLQRLINRVYDVEKTKENIIRAAGKGIMIGAFFMIGFPTENMAEAMETIDFIKSLDCVTMPFIFGVKYFPGTPLTRYAMENLYIDKSALDGIYQPYHNFSSLKTSALTGLEFKKIFYIYLKEIFLNRKRLSRALKTQKKHLSKKELAGLYSSFFNKKITDPFLFFKKYPHNHN